MRIPQSLPVPSPQALQHSAQLLELIRQQIIQSGGSIPFSRFMHMALYQPGLGYYVAGQQKFGSQGDFVTAPEISPLFSQCIANYCSKIFATTGTRQIFELGAGTGIMASDILLRLAERQTLPDQYLILEPAPDLQERQYVTLMKRCPHLATKVTWLKQLPEQPIHGVILANEVLDAMPVELFSIQGEIISTVHVTQSDGELSLQEMLPDNRQKEYISNTCTKFRDQEYDSYRPEQAFLSEYNPALTAWINSLANVLAKGAMLLIDYGYERSEYYHPKRNRGTLLCHYRHHVHDQPLLWPGLQDITASVDFTAVAEAAEQAGLKIDTYTTQANFLFENGLETLFNQTLQAQPQQQYQLAQQVRTLTLPAEMGERFKAISLTKGFTLADQNNTLAGLKHTDRRHYL